LRVGYEHTGLATSFELRTEVVVRPVRGDDLEHLEWFGEFTHHRNIIESVFEKHLKGEVLMLVADLNGFPAAQAWLDLPATTEEPAYVWAVRVHDIFQGMGIGSHLMYAVEEFARNHGARALELEVDQDNLGGYRFYCRMCYEVVGEEVGDYRYVDIEGHPVRVLKNNWRMRKELHIGEPPWNSVDLR
jgi:ribosomal protein S18 acetylase RimI-like enzyme